MWQGSVLRTPLSQCFCKGLMLCGQKWTMLCSVMLRGEGAELLAAPVSPSPLQWPSEGGSAPVRSERSSAWLLRLGLVWFQQVESDFLVLGEEKIKMGFSRVLFSKVSSELSSFINADRILGCTKGELNLFWNPAFGVSLLLLDRMTDLENIGKLLGTPNSPQVTSG